MTDGFAPPPSLDGPRAASPAGSGAGAPTPAPLASPPRPRRPRRRRGVVLAWIVGGAAAVAIGGGVVADLALTAHQRSLEPVARGYAGGLEGIQAVAGLCLVDAPEGESVDSLIAVACADPHRAEVVAELRLGGAWSGDDALARQAEDFCSVQVARLVSGELAEGARWRVWVPTERTWAAGDRAALCVVVTDRDVTGSFEAGTAA
ncbi:septum formation family protein [Demequina sp. SYSU T00068]|uniref:septum formation family protein n=1 Tax=Demequina lignilytica TaxID=3051663 RepID=UPI002603235D|nr:septum formation family protein [Demequina sp. SYSU T00068]MDN4491661.1 septum formation family protein [Demequina sp. SYSU T00068]